MTTLTPREIVSELDRFIIGQEDAKKAVAIALRNRWRRSQLDDDLREEVVPKNILMIGPTGCGKTEIARRLAKLANAPFIKVEATKFTEVGYVGRDVESIIRDLTEYAMTMVREEHRAEVKVKAEGAAENRVLDALVGESASEDTRRKFREKLRAGELDDKEIEIDVLDNGNAGKSFDIPGMPGGSVGMINMNDLLGGAMGERTKTKKCTVLDSYDILIAEEADKLTDEEKITADALKRVEDGGIAFIDEIDKVCARSDAKGGEVSREGVQRDLLPLLEGTIVTTKYGQVKTDHILFITSGAFHMAKPADLLPELQGRLPIRVELEALTEDDLLRILTETEASLTKQTIALMATENATITFTDDGVAELAKLATRFNKEVENIGARRLHTIIEKLMEDVSFNCPDQSEMAVEIDAPYVQEHIGEMAKEVDLDKFIL